MEGDPQGIDKKPAEVFGGVIQGIRYFCYGNGFREMLLNIQQYFSRALGIKRLGIFLFGKISDDQHQ